MLKSRFPTKTVLQSGGLSELTKKLFSGAALSPRPAFAEGERCEGSGAKDMRISLSMHMVPVRESTALAAAAAWKDTWQ